MGKIHILIQGTIYMNFCFKTRNWANQAVVVDLAKQIVARYEKMKRLENKFDEKMNQIIDLLKKKEEWR